MLCSTAPCSDLVVESTEASGVDDIAPQRVRTRVARIEHASADHAVVHLKIRRARVLRYLAGQRATVRFEDGPARESWLASCPCDAVNLRFHVRRDPGDAFAAHVFGVAGRGVNAAVEGPTGRFVLDDNSPRALLFVAFDTGFAPIESLIEHAINLEIEVPIRLVRVVPERGLPYRHNYCRAWADALDDFDYRVVEIPSDAGMALHAAAARVLDAASVPDAALGGTHGVDAYVAGPHGLAGACRDLLIDRGVPAARVKTDSLD